MPMDGVVSPSDRFGGALHCTTRRVCPLGWVGVRLLGYGTAGAMDGFKGFGGGEWKGPVAVPCRADFLFFSLFFLSLL